MSSSVIQPKNPTFVTRRENGWISTPVSPTVTPRIKPRPDSPSSVVPRELFAEMLSTTRTIARDVLPAVKGAVDITKSNHGDESKCTDISLGVGASSLDMQINRNVNQRKRRNTTRRVHNGVGRKNSSMMQHLRRALSEQLDEHKLHPQKRRLSSKNLARSQSPYRYLEECTFRVRQIASDNIRKKFSHEKIKTRKKVRDWHKKRNVKKISLCKYSDNQWDPTSSTLRPAFKPSNSRYRRSSLSAQRRDGGYSPRVLLR